MFSQRHRQNENMTFYQLTQSVWLTNQLTGVGSNSISNTYASKNPLSLRPCMCGCSKSFQRTIAIFAPKNLFTLKTTRDQRKGENKTKKCLLNFLTYSCLILSMCHKALSLNWFDLNWFPRPFSFGWVQFQTVFCCRKTLAEKITFKVEILPH